MFQTQNLELNFIVAFFLIVVGVLDWKLKKGFLKTGFYLIIVLILGVIIITEFGGGHLFTWITFPLMVGISLVFNRNPVRALFALSTMAYLHEFIWDIIGIYQKEVNLTKAFSEFALIGLTSFLIYFFLYKPKRIYLLVIYVGFIFSWLVYGIVYGFPFNYPLMNLFWSYNNISDFWEIGSWLVIFGVFAINEKN